jgi:hypothetical protein
VVLKLENVCRTTVKTFLAGIRATIKAGLGMSAADLIEAMLAATPFPRGSGAKLAVAGFVIGTHSDQLLPSGHSS